MRIAGRNGLGLSLLLACIAGMPISATAGPGLILEYGQSSKVWPVLYEVQTARGDLQKINRILNENFGTYQTTFARFGSDFDVHGFQGLYLNKIKLSIVAEAAALGLVQNPVLPELLASLIAVGLVRVSFHGFLSVDRSWVYESALVGGHGVERRLSAVSTDLIEKIPFQKANVWLAGIDLLGKKIWNRKKDKIEIKGEVRGTHYNGLEGQTSVSLDRKLRKGTYQWDIRIDYAREWWGLHGILGSHPLPTELLPRVWDRVANTTPWRELGAMSGFGARAKYGLGAKSKMVLLGGFYAGYIGGELQLHTGARTNFRFASYKIENSSAYRSLGQRVYVFLSYISF